MLYFKVLLLKTRCLLGARPLTHSCRRCPLMSGHLGVLPWVTGTAECSLDVVDQGAWNESQIKGVTWFQALLLHYLLHTVDEVWLWAMTEGTLTNCTYPSDGVLTGTKKLLSSHSKARRHASKTGHINFHHHSEISVALVRQPVVTQSEQRTANEGKLSQVPEL